MKSISALETPVMVQPEKYCATCPPYPRSVERDCRQVFPSQPSYSDRMVSSPEDFQSNLPEVTPTLNRSVCLFNQKLPQFVSPVPDKEAWAVDTLNLSWQDPDGYSPDSECHKQDSQPQLLEDYSHSSGWACHGGVLGSSEPVIPDPPLPATPNQPSYPAIQWEPVKTPHSESPSLVPCDSTIRIQGFSGQVAEWIEAPQRSSSKAVYEAKWSIYKNAICKPNS